MGLLVIRCMYGHVEKGSSGLLWQIHTYMIFKYTELKSNFRNVSTMYVCMYRGRPSWRCPWDPAFQLGQGEGPIGPVGPISQPRGTDTASLTLDRTHTINVRFLSQL